MSAFSVPTEITRHKLVRPRRVQAVQLYRQAARRTFYDGELELLVYTLALPPGFARELLEWQEFERVVMEIKA